MPSKTQPSDRPGLAQPALLTWGRAAEVVGVSRRQLRRMVAAGHFPAPAPVPGLASRRFKRDDVQAWLTAR